MHYPTWQSRSWLLLGNFKALWRVVLYGGPPLLPVVIPGISGPFSDGLPAWFPVEAWVPTGLIAGWFLLFALFNLLVAALLGRRAGIFEDWALQLLDGQLGALAHFCMFRVEIVHTVSRVDSRVVALAAAITFLPGILVLSIGTLICLVVPMLLAVLLTLLSGTIPGWWLAFAPRVIRIVDNAAYMIMTGREPDYRIELAPLDYELESAIRKQLRPPGDAPRTDRSQLWRSPPRTPSA